MKIRTLVAQSLLAGMLGFSANASAGFDFSSPFDMFDNDDDSYRYGSRDGRGYGGERWRQYDEWEPNYWRYRYFDNDSRDYFFDGGGFGDGRFDMNMNMDFDSDSRFDGYDQFRNRGGRNFSGFDNMPGFDRDRYGDRSDQSRDRGYGRGYDRGYENYDRRAPESNSRDQYNDDYWRNYSQRYNGNERRR